MFKIGTKFINAIHFKGAKEDKNIDRQKSPQKPEINELQKTNPDYQVKTPMAYSPMPDLNLPNDLKAKCYKLANGQKVVIMSKKGMTTIRTYVNTGSMNEPDNLRGISHYIEHNLFNGSEGLNAGEFFQKVHRHHGDRRNRAARAEHQSDVRLSRPRDHRPQGDERPSGSGNPPETDD